MVFQRYIEGLLINPSGKNRHPITAEAKMAKPNALNNSSYTFYLIEQNHQKEYWLLQIRI
jgi:hypothetical protein